MNFPFDPEYVSQRLTEVGTYARNLPAIVRDGDASWTVAFPESVVLVEWVADPVRLVMSVDIGKAPAARQGEVQMAALSYNLLWRDTGGARIGMAGEEGDLVLARELGLESIQGNGLAEIIEQFAEGAKWWTGYVASEEIGLPSPGFGMAELSARV